MAWRISPSGSSFSALVTAEFIDPETGQKADVIRKSQLYFDRLRVGQPLANFDDWPKEGLMHNRRKNLPELFPLWGIFCGQQSFVDLVEKFEPGVHEWLPMQFRMKQTGELYREQYFVLNICQCLKSVVLDHPSVRVKTFPSGKVSWAQKTGKIPIVLHKHVVEGKHLWRDAGGGYSRLDLTQSRKHWSNVFLKVIAKFGQYGNDHSLSIEEI